MTTINVKGFTSRILASRRVVPSMLGAGMVPPILSDPPAPVVKLWSVRCDGCQTLYCGKCPECR